ncbi:putative minor tail protein [Synechococcus phage S-LBS1]|nr:putative minor tail protein [Synechococcus phage S-LBS1]
MATFPVLEPATRAYDFGLFPLTEEPSVSAGIVRFRHSVTQQNYQLTLGYVDLTDAEASLIREHYQSQGGGYLSFQLPATVWAGHTFSGNIVPYTTRWRYIETPEEEHSSAGYVNVTVTLGSDGTIDAELGLQDVDITLVSGAATGA